MSRSCDAARRRAAPSASGGRGARKRLLAHDLAVAEREERPVVDLPLAELQPAVRPEHVERVLASRRRRCRSATRRARAAGRRRARGAGRRDAARRARRPPSSRPAPRTPSRRCRSAQRARRRPRSRRSCSARPARRGARRAARRRSRSARCGRRRPDPWRIGMVVRSDRRMALREVAHVHEQLVRAVRHGDALEQLRRRRLLLDDDERRAGARGLGYAYPTASVPRSAIAASSACAASVRSRREWGAREYPAIPHMS